MSVAEFTKLAEKWQALIIMGLVALLSVIIDERARAPNDQADRGRAEQLKSHVKLASRPPVQRLVRFRLPLLR
jgi:hypothetical protein